MIYLSGVDCLAARELEGVGLISQPGSYGPEACKHYPYFALDNGCFTAKWDETKWLRWLDRQPRQGCLFAVVPDVVCNPEDTQVRWALYSWKVRQMGFPTAYVLQNGQPWDQIPYAADWVFIGGDTTWKTGSEAAWLTMLAHHRGQRVHMGRANSLKRLKRAQEMHCDSADGTFLKYAPEKNRERLAKFLSSLPPEPQLALA